ncbi:hypothetical protein [Moraxella sp. RCAD0137]|uniref:hypothetical protein n=1 Tax=Moraxella sp. RCAD0137 TaxID=1775913 RepID=UPI000C9ECEF3|nr:hypothetical protein [Moraxella sp. RCAD0137]PNP98370.1 hypothetical protein AZ602_04150 [Moraxella sp. RCAD0137]
MTMTNKDRPPKQFTFKMGDVIYTNGRIIDKKNIDMNNKSPEIQKCLASASGIAELGTIDIEKYDLSDKRQAVIGKIVNFSVKKYPNFDKLGCLF